MNNLPDDEIRVHQFMAIYTDTMSAEAYLDELWEFYLASPDALTKTIRLGTYQSVVMGYRKLGHIGYSRVGSDVLRQLV